MQHPLMEKEKFRERNPRKPQKQNGKKELIKKRKRKNYSEKRRMLSYKSGYCTTMPRAIQWNNRLSRQSELINGKKMVLVSPIRVKVGEYVR